jgi:hypothetical protein
MKPSPILTIVFALLIAVSTAHCGDSSESYQRPKIWPKPTPPPDASPVYHDVKERAATEEEIDDDAASYYPRLERQFTEGLKSADAQKREAAMVFLLPELLQVEPKRVVDLHDSLEPGAVRDVLRTEVARLWANQDLPAAIRWMKSLDEKERRLAVYEAVDSLLAFEPAQAMSLIREFDLERDERLRKLLATLRN